MKSTWMYVIGFWPEDHSFLAKAFVFPQICFASYQDNGHTMAEVMHLGVPLKYM